LFFSYLKKKYLNNFSALGAVFIMMAHNLFITSRIQSTFNTSIVMRNKKNETVTLKKGGKDILLDYADLRKAVLVLRAVNHKLRQRIINLLEESDSITVTDIYIKLRLEQSVASQHLAILRRAGVVLTERKGKFIYYSLDEDRLAQISALVEELAG
jgi:DNA-binding transcriptional ArsR family regulator